MRVRLEAIGCRLNTSEIEALGHQLRAAGYTVVGSNEAADVVILNSCAVTATAAGKSRQALRSLRRQHPASRLVVTGCLAELEPDQLQALAADQVVGNQGKEQLVQLLTGANAAGPAAAPDPWAMMSPPGERRTRLFLKVQDGCDCRCAYCVVTIARGPGRSVAAEQVLRRVIEARRAGYQEVVLSGVHLGSYGHDLGDRHGLRHLVQQLLDSSDLPRLRLSSIEPWDLEPGLIELFADHRLLPHLHLPLQSGCEATLQRMHRPLSAAAYNDLVDSIVEQVPGIAISTDIMVGFPGETEQEHDESMRLVERLGFSRLHVFRYSPRPGTVAAGLPGAVPAAVARSRSRRMHELGRRLARRFAERNLGRTVPVLWEECQVRGDRLRWRGLSPSYLRVCTETGPATDLWNRIMPTALTALDGDGLIGCVRSPDPAARPRQEAAVGEETAPVPEENL